MSKHGERLPDWEARLSSEGEDTAADREDTAPPLPQLMRLAGEATLEERVALLPTAAGVYLMKDAEGRVIYVGKAQSLRSRVRSYFRVGGDTRTFAEFLRRKIADVEFVITTNSKEALLLENTLIKKHRPRYNIQLRDDKTYVSLRLDTTHEWPRLHRTRKRRAGDKALYFGPYASSTGVRETLKFLQKLFPIRSCPDSVLAHRSRPCVLHQIGRCCAPCVGLADRMQYDSYVQSTALFLRGRADEVAKLLRRTMEEYAENLEFERAASIRDRLRGVERTLEREKVHSHRAFDRDVIVLNRSRGTMLVTVMHFRKGRLDETRHFDFRDHDEEDGALLEAFIGQHYTGGRVVPRDVLAGSLPDGREFLESLLSELRDGPVRIAVPERGEKRRLIEMALANGREALERRLAGEQSRGAVLEDLQRALSMPSLPRRIECFDISNFQGSFPVGSMTSFLDGEPDKSQYRKFKIRTVEGQDDFAMIREVVKRRYSRLQAANAPMPDLIVIDGGKGQLASACDALRELGLMGKLTIVGLAKARVLPTSLGSQIVRHSEERIFVPGRKNPITLNRSNPGLFILMRIRDEAHRFGVTFHRKLRGKGALTTGLEGIPGLGPTRKRALLRHFGSLAKLRAAGVDEIAQVKGMPRALAEAVVRHLAPQSEHETPPSE